MRAELHAKVEEHAGRLAELRDASTTPLQWCGFIEDFLYVDKVRSFLCCIEGAPSVDFDAEQGVPPRWEHPTFTTFRADFLSGKVPGVCEGCHERKSVAAAVMLADVDAALASL